MSFVLHDFGSFSLFVPHIFSKKPIVAGFFGKTEDFVSEENTKNFFGNPSHLRFSRPLQVHGTHLLDTEEQKKEGDGVFTKEKNFVCTTRFADCIGALFYDEYTGEIAAIHAGWKGLAQKIFSCYLQKFEKTNQILVALSPSLGPCCAEFSDPFQETPSFFHDNIEKRGGKFFVDLWEIARKELLEVGVLEKNLEMPNFCTHCSGKDYWWSFRHGHAERGIGVIWKI